MNILGYAQKLGKALMLPIATLPIAALLLRLGSTRCIRHCIYGASWWSDLRQSAIAIWSRYRDWSCLKTANGAAGLAGAVAYFVLTATATTINAQYQHVILRRYFRRYHRWSLLQRLPRDTSSRVASILFRQTSCTYHGGSVLR